MKKKKRSKMRIPGENNVVDVCINLKGAMGDFLEAYGMGGLSSSVVTVTVLYAIYQRFVALRGFRDVICMATIPDHSIMRRAFWLELQRITNAEKAEDLMGVALSAMTSADARKKGGVHYTPRHLTRRVASRTLAPLFRIIGPGKELELRVCDPACGGGIFLSEIVDQIAARLPGGRSSHNLRMAAIHCAYGVDKDICAVCCSKLVLRLQCQAFNMPAGWLNSNIKHGDALVGADNDQIGTFRCTWKKEQIHEQIPRISRLICDAMELGTQVRQTEMEVLRELSSASPLGASATPL